MTKNNRVIMLSAICLCMSSLSATAASNLSDNSFDRSKQLSRSSLDGAMPLSPDELSAQPPPPPIRKTPEPTLFNAFGLLAPAEIEVPQAPAPATTHAVAKKVVTPIRKTASNPPPPVMKHEEAADDHDTTLDDIGDFFNRLGKSVIPGSTDTAPQPAPVKIAAPQPTPLLKKAPAPITATTEKQDGTTLDDIDDFFSRMGKKVTQPLADPVAPVIHTPVNTATAPPPKIKPTPVITNDDEDTSTLDDIGDFFDRMGKKIIHPSSPATTAQDAPVETAPLKLAPVKTSPTPFKKTQASAVTVNNDDDEDETTLDEIGSFFNRMGKKIIQTPTGAPGNASTPAYPTTNK